MYTPAWEVRELIGGTVVDGRPLLCALVDRKRGKLGSTYIDRGEFPSVGSNSRRSKSNTSSPPAYMMLIQCKPKGRGPVSQNVTPVVAAEPALMVTREAVF